MLRSLVKTPSSLPRCRFGGRESRDVPPSATHSRLTPGVQSTVEQGQEAGLPEGVAAVHQLVATALEAALEAHLPAGHPALWGTDRSGCQREDGDLPGTANLP